MEYKIYKDYNQSKNTILLFIFSIIFFIYLIYKESNSENYSVAIIFLEVLEVIIITFLVILLIKILIKIIMKEPYMIFSEKNIKTNGLITKYTLNWDDIKNVTHINFRGLPFIVFKFKKDNLYSKHVSFTHKLLMNYNIKKTGGELAVSYIFLDDNYNNINNLINIKMRNRSI